jgi:hypothetical protein
MRMGRIVTGENMNRRGFIGGALAAAVGAALPKLPKCEAATVPQERIPGINYFRCPDHFLPDGVKVFINGKDITNVTSEFDTREGWIRRYQYRRKLDGSIIFLEGEQVIDRGKVELRPQPTLAQLTERIRFNGEVAGYGRASREREADKPVAELESLREYIEKLNEVRDSTGQIQHRVAELGKVQ